VKGSFTGASADRSGLFESAAGGTLFLDEITETELSFQVKILRLLQEGEYRPVGTNIARKADVRILAASNLDVASIKAERFREDLYYRLATFTIDLPPLRRRADDIPLLVTHFLKQLSQRLARMLTITPSALKILSSHDWPGNVRQLRNALEKLAILSPDGSIQEEDVKSWAQEITGKQLNEAGPTQSLSHVEKERIREVLAQSLGNKTRAAALLGIDRSTLHRKMQAYGLSRESADDSTTVKGAS
jgi:DNA-binding NtrC family response regulator